MILTNKKLKKIIYTHNGSSENFFTGNYNIFPLFTFIQMSL